MKPYGLKQQKNRIEKAKALFAQGRDIPFVKKITSLTLAAMKREGLIFEIVIPDPEDKSSMPKMIHTGQFRPSLV